MQKFLIISILAKAFLRKLWTNNPEEESVAGQD